jgi:hypothetical protein
MTKKQELAPMFGDMIYTLNKVGVTNLSFLSNQVGDDIEVTIGFSDKQGRRTNLVWDINEKSSLTRSYMYRGDLKTLTYAVPKKLIAIVDRVMVEIASIPLGVDKDDSNSYVENVLHLTEKESNMIRSSL